MHKKRIDLPQISQKYINTLSLSRLHLHTLYLVTDRICHIARASDFIYVKDMATL